MHDRVADILAQRAKLENGAGAALFVSLLFHGFLSGLALWAAWHHAAQNIPPVMAIRFAQPEPVEMAPAATVKPARPPSVKPAPKPKVDVKSVPMSPFGKSTLKGREEALLPAPPARVPVPAPATPKALEVPVGGSGVTSLEGGDFPYSIYIDRMKALIGTHWFRPQVTGETSAIVYFAIQRDGTLRDVNIEAPSGDGVYDRAALRAVMETSPLPPLPFGYAGSYLGVHLRFR